MAAYLRSTVVLSRRLNSYIKLASDSACAKYGIEASKTRAGH